MKKIYILDATILLHSPEHFLSLTDEEIIIPKQELESVHSRKKSMEEIGKNARYVSQLLYTEIENAISSGKGLKLSFANYDHLKKNMPTEGFIKPDEKLLFLGRSIERREKKLGSNKQVIILTKDVIQRIKGSAIGLICSKI